MSGENLSDEDPAHTVVLDACVAINLYASGRIDDILANGDFSFAISKFSAKEEVLWVGEGRLSDPESDVERVELEPLIAGGYLELVDLSTDAEAATMVALAAVIDDGEAIAGAVAIHRGHVLATDDRKAIIEIKKLKPSQKVVGTTSILRRWATKNRIKRMQIVELLRRIKTRARFVPPISDPDFEWWTKNAA